MLLIQTRWNDPQHDSTTPPIFRNFKMDKGIKGILDLGLKTSTVKDFQIVCSLLALFHSKLLPRLPPETN